MTGLSRLRCPKCGTQMNRHAEKLVYVDNPADARRMDVALGGIVEETHACPGCGNIEARRLGG
jgi:ribosomal protein S27AE